MKITDRLIGDHKTFRKMIADLETIANAKPAERDRRKLLRLVELFKDHLLLHAWFEDTFYYPAISAGLDPARAPRLNAAYMSHLDHEHKTVDGYIDRLEDEVKANPPVPWWPQTFALFQRGLESHMRREEEELFPWSEDLLGAEKLEALSLEMEKNRAKAPPIRTHTRAD